MPRFKIMSEQLHTTIGEFTKEARSYLQAISLEVVAKRGRCYDVTDLAGCRSRLDKACDLLDSQEAELKRLTKRLDMLVKRNSDIAKIYETERAELAEAKERIEVALLELANIEGEKTPTEIRVEQALKAEQKRTG